MVSGEPAGVFSFPNVKATGRDVARTLAAYCRYHPRRAAETAAGPPFHSMTLVSVKSPGKAGPAILRVEFSDGSKFSLNSAYLSPDAAELAPGMEISPELEASLRYAAACYRAERVALAFVARAEQTRAGLRRKLERKGIPRPEIDAALDILEDSRILSDERYAERWLQAKLRPALAGRASRLGPRRLLAALAGRGIARGTARDALDRALDAETETALIGAVLAAAFGGDLPAPGEIRRVLRGEGFSGASIRAWEEEYL